MGLKFVRERDTKTPFEPELNFHRRVGDAAFERGLILYPMGGTIDGRRGDHLLVAPPFIIPRGQIDRLVETLARALDDALKQVAERT